MIKKPNSKNSATIVVLLSWFACQQLPGEENKLGISPDKIDQVICFWDFQEKKDGKVNLTSTGPNNYTLVEMNGPIRQIKEGVFGQSALEIERGQWLRILREDCPALNIHGKQEVSVVAWIKRRADIHWQYIAGMWDERNSARQYALFTSGHKKSDYKTLQRTDANHQAHGYVSEVGGATPGRPFAFSYATGGTTLESDNWYMVAFTYDHKAVKVYIDGGLDENGNCNPFYWDKPIYNAGDKGGDFTVAQRSVPSWPDFPEGVPGNKVGFGGILGGLAVYSRALKPDEITCLYESTITKQ